MIPASDWEWYGNAGHFICGDRCRFHLCTKIGPFVVSTVGEYVPAFGSCTEEIGHDRKYETMVFRHIGSSCECGCGMPDHDGRNIDFDGYNTPADARDGHMAMCEKYAKEDDR